MEGLEWIGTPRNKMPELPEVETIKNILKQEICGKTIANIEIIRKKTILSDVDDFIKNLTNQTFLDITRKGKYIIFHLSKDNVLIAHLRMEGKFYLYKQEDNNSKYPKIIFHLTNGEKLIFDDSRCFGILIHSKENEYLSLKEIACLGPEPFQISDVNILKEKCKNCSLPIKSKILDQTLISGLGNIYADETLFACKINPYKKAKDITLEEWKNIISNACIILTKAIQMGGSTIKSYHPKQGMSGNFQTVIEVYGKKGKPCSNCHTPLAFTKINGRGTTYCPLCQRMNKNKINIGLTGKLASGKSSVLKICHSENYPTISSDEIVTNLYKNKDVSTKIKKELNINCPSLIDKTILSTHLKKYPLDKTKLEEIIFPLVKEEIIKFLSSSKGPINVVEVPLLFEAHMEELFDVIIAIDINNINQRKRLEKRNKDTADFLLSIYDSSIFDKNKKKATYLITNDGTENELKNKIIDLLNKVKSHLN